MKNDTTHFGFKEVHISEKALLVNAVFDSVADRYDLMNDFMSFGIHRIWKRHLVYYSGVHCGCKVLDLAGGTGDLSIKFSRLVGDTGIVVLLDINESMLKKGRERLRNLGMLKNIIYVQADVEFLPFSDNTFDCIAVSFGLRNFTDKNKALCSMYRVLKIGGKLLVLDFGVTVSRWISTLYDFYSFHVIPKMGKILAGQFDSYRYLVESIRMHPNEEKLKNMILKSGFSDVNYFSMTGGIVVLHCAYK